MIASPWTFGWDSLVAIGTLGLAAVTVGLGFVAWRGNRLARQGVEIATAELKASMLPLIEAVPPMTDEQRKMIRERRMAPTDRLDYTNVGGSDEKRWAYVDLVDVYGTPRGAFCSIPIQNVGHGIARISDVKPRALSVPDVLWTDGAATRALIPAGERARLHFNLSGVRDEIYAEVFYSDIGGEQATRARFYLKREVDESGQSLHDAEGQPTYAVRGTAMYRVGEDEPFAVTGDASVTAPQPSPRPRL